jgi:hypothetical protein
MTGNTPGSRLAYESRAGQPPVDIFTPADGDIGAPAHWEGHHLA